MTIDLVKARALCAAATPGKWYAKGRGVYTDDLGAKLDLLAHCGGLADTRPEDRAAFIAAARTLLPEALDEIERLQQRYNVQADGWKAANERLTQIMAENARLKKSLEEADRLIGFCSDPYMGPPMRSCGECDICHFRAALAAPQTGGDGG